MDYKALAKKARDKMKAKVKPLDEDLSLGNEDEQAYEELVDLEDAETLEVSPRDKLKKRAAKALAKTR